MERTIALDGCFNFRDLGGYPTTDGRKVLWRQLFRSDGLQQLTATDVSRIRDDLRIGDVVDLRSTYEVRSEGRGPLEAEPLRFHHIPLFDGDTRGAREGASHISLGQRYFLLAQLAAERIAQVITTIAASDDPVLYHCAAGKDRTGVISAILLAVLGVPDPVIVADYAATKENLDAIVNRLMSLEGYRTMLSDLPPDTLHAEPGTMVEFLEAIRGQHGSMREYARQAGVSVRSLDRLRERLVGG